MIHNVGLNLYTPFVYKSIISDARINEVNRPSIVKQTKDRKNIYQVGENNCIESMEFGFEEIKINKR